MYRCESWTIKKTEHRIIDASLTVGLEKTLKTLLDFKEIKAVNPKVNQPGIFSGRTDAEAKAPILWQPDEKSWLMVNTLMLGKTEDRSRRGWQGWDGWRHYQLNGHESEQIMEDSRGQRSLACCSPWGHKESETTEQMNNNQITTRVYLRILFPER